MASFIPGLELNRLFYEEAVGPILAARFPGLRYSAALIGYGSDVLGYDTALSADHEWGPRLLLFLRDEEHAALAGPLDETLRRELPPTFRGYPTNFSSPDAADDGVRHLEAGEAGRVNHHIQLWTVADFLSWELGVASEASLTARDWLTFPEQKLLDVTAGAVYHDGLGRLLPLRRRLRYYPHDVWLYRLGAQWRRIAQEEAFVGRAGDVGDELGSRILAARLAREVMRLCFLLERRYAPYGKWLGTAFARLECAGAIAPLLSAALAAPTWREREQSLTHAYEGVARRQNALGVAAPQEPSARPYYGRPYRVISADRFATALTAAIQEPELRQIAADSGLVGGVDQFADSTDVLQRTNIARRLGALYTV